MDINEHAQIIYAQMLQGWMSTHPGQLEASTMNSLAANAWLAARTFHDTSLGETTRK